MNDVIRWDERAKCFNPAAIDMRCDDEQYRMLKCCSESGDISVWNNWRKKNPGQEIWLCGADLSYAHLSAACLDGAHLEEANLQGAWLDREAYLQEACLRKADLMSAHLEGAVLNRSRLEEARLRKADLSHAKLLEANLDGADLLKAKLRGANFTAAIISDKTLLWDCEIDEETLFTGTGLDSARVEPGLKEQLKANIREKRWREWCTKGKWWRRSMTQWITRAFWWMSDYGRSTRRILTCFFGLALAFGLFYWLAPNMLKVDGKVGDVRSLWHALYFSVVTMTTLGFGDVHARPDGWWGMLGQTVLMVQVILGYVLLGALVTRFAILFSGEGPAARPSPPAKNPGNKS